MKKRLAEKIIVVLSLFSLILFFEGIFTSKEVSADSQACSVNKTNCFNGFEHTFGAGGTAVTSVYADISTPSYMPTVGSQGSSSAWPMIVNDTKYVQVGWIKTNKFAGNYGSGGLGQVFPSDGEHFFYEINYGYSSIGTSLGDYQVYSAKGPAAGSVNGYRVEKSGNYWAGEVNGNQIAAFPLSYDTDKFLYSGTAVQFSEEINSAVSNPQSSAFAGGANYRSKFSNVRAFFNGKTYYSPSITRYFTDTSASQNRSHYGDTSVYSNQSNSYIEFWDSRY
ncbi:hypothetical protein QWJ34_26315 [Saccharibacillus sp. CPCC 101409]|uniref:hypothetical protein n=1 Tax=Saccharibacillus sp. CPCC 101409 TaxID=3058041 RepID=UPI002671FC0D|nr:hypothetical protein [Saccharibacillus sp. CPCC 101409]MDO3413294.1 hypothetical protein [Saccharibacillus sp. CPCC 101409]